MEYTELRQDDQEREAMVAMARDQWRDRLFAAIAEKRITVKQLAIDLYPNQPPRWHSLRVALSNYKRTGRGLSLQTFIQIADYLGIEIE